MPLEQFTDQMRKAKNLLESRKFSFHKGQYLKKPSNINPVLVSKHPSKKLWNLLTQLLEFTAQEI